MTVEFKLPKNIRFSEELGLNISFQEVRIRGEKEYSCQVLVTEEGNGIDVHDMYNFSSWDEMKETYPSLIDFLKELSVNELWFSSWRANDRIYFISRLTGHEGLYDIKKTVWFDAQDNED